VSRWNNANGKKTNSWADESTDIEFKDHETGFEAHRENVNWSAVDTNGANFVSRQGKQVEDSNEVISCISVTSPRIDDSGTALLFASIEAPKPPTEQMSSSTGILAVDSTMDSSNDTALDQEGDQVPTSEVENTSSLTLEGTFPWRHSVLTNEDTISCDHMNRIEPSPPLDSTNSFYGEPRGVLDTFGKINSGVDNTSLNEDAIDKVFTSASSEQRLNMQTVLLPSKEAILTRAAVTTLSGKFFCDHSTSSVASISESSLDSQMAKMIDQDFLHRVCSHRSHDNEDSESSMESIPPPRMDKVTTNKSWTSTDLTCVNQTSPMWPLPQSIAKKNKDIPGSCGTSDDTGHSDDEQYASELSACEFSNTPVSSHNYSMDEDGSSENSSLANSFSSDPLLKEIEQHVKQGQKPVLLSPSPFWIVLPHISIQNMRLEAIFVGAKPAFKGNKFCFDWDSRMWNAIETRPTGVCSRRTSNRSNVSLIEDISIACELTAKCFDHDVTRDLLKPRAKCLGLLFLWCDSHLVNVVACVAPSAMEKHKAIEILRIATPESHRHKGYARLALTLIMNAVTNLATQTHKKIFLNGFRCLTRFYIKCGFCKLESANQYEDMQGGNGSLLTAFQIDLNPAYLHYLLKTAIQKLRRRKFGEGLFSSCQDEIMQQDSPPPKRKKCKRIHKKQQASNPDESMVVVVDEGCPLTSCINFGIQQVKDNPDCNNFMLKVVNKGNPLLANMDVDLQNPDRNNFKHKVVNKGSAHASCIDLDLPQDEENPDGHNSRLKAVNKDNPLVSCHDIGLPLDKGNPYWKNFNLKVVNKVNPLAPRIDVNLPMEEENPDWNNFIGVGQAHYKSRKCKKTEVVLRSRRAIDEDMLQEKCRLINQVLNVTRRIGDIVLVSWRGKFYPGTIEKVSCLEYLIRWLDGSGTNTVDKGAYILPWNVAISLDDAELEE